MATLRKTGYVRTNNTDADFRAWAQFIHDVLDAGGWVQTSDTGQIDLGTVTVPTGANEKKGYEIWRMDDTLQATAPVFMRIDYGSGGSAATPGIWLELGLGSDGAGAITDVRFSSTEEMGGTSALITGLSSGTSADNVMLGSAGDSRFAFALFSDNMFGNGAGGPQFGVERLKTEDGGDSPSGLFVAWATTAAVGLTRSRVVYLTRPSPARQDNYLAFIGSGGATPGIFTPEVGVGVIYPLEGGRSLPYVHNFVALAPGDWRTEAEFDLHDEACGVDIRFRRIGGVPAPPLAAAFAVLAIRWD
jgi:hypothetical protein